MKSSTFSADRDLMTVIVVTVAGMALALATLGVSSAQATPSTKGDAAIGQRVVVAPGDEQSMASTGAWTEYHDAINVSVLAVAAYDHW